MKTGRWMVLACMLGSVVYADEGGKPVAVVNGVSIGQQAFDQLLQQSLKQGGQDTPQLRQRVRDQLIARELFLQEAKKRNLDTDAQVLAAVEEAKNNAMIQRYLKEAIQPKSVSDEELHAQYDKTVAMLGPKEYKLRVIQVATEAKARQLLTRVKKGESFAELAQQESLSPSAQRSGELDWLSFKTPAREGETGRLPLAIAQAVEKLDKGKVSEPVTVKDLWWLVKIEDVRPTHVPTFDEARPALLNALNGRELERSTTELVQKLLKAATISQ